MLAQAPASVNPSSNVANFPVLTIPAVHAIRDAKLGGFEKAVLYALASRLPTVRPSVALICQDCGFGRSKVLAVLRSLEARGMVRRSRLGGRYGTNAYELDLEAIRRERQGSPPRTQGSPPRTQGSVLRTSEGSVLRTLRDKGEKRQEGALTGIPEGEGRGKQEVHGSPPTNPTPVIPPTRSAPAEPSQQEVGDRPSEPPPESGRFELPDVCFEEPAIVDRETEALYRRKREGKPLVTEPKHLVAGFNAAHEEVYGFPSLELRGPKLWKCAVTAAARLVEGAFKGDLREAEVYVGWAWERERKARKAGKHRDRPIGWPLMFGQMVGDYFKAKREKRAA